MIVRDSSGEEREYFILHFPIVSDVLDIKHSTFFGKAQLIKPVFSLKKIGGHKVFNYDVCNFFSFFISEDIRNAIQEAGCTNLNISKVPLSD